MAAGKEKRTRTRSGCLNCRRRRRKCDEAKPICMNCSKRNETCQRGVRLSFREENAQTIDGHGGLEEDHPLEDARPSKRAKPFEIVDVTTAVVDQYHRYSPDRQFGTVFLAREDATTRKTQQAKDHSTAQKTAGSRRPKNISDGSALVTSPFSNSVISNHLSPDLGRQIVEGVPGEVQVRPVTAGSGTEVVSSTSPPAYLSLNSHVRSLSATHGTTEDAAQNLLYLRQMQKGVMSQCAGSTPYAAVHFDMSPPFSFALDQITPESFFDDGIFLPGSTYQELHATLRQHLIDETISGAQSRQHTPQVEYEPRTLRQVSLSRLRDQVEDTEPFDNRTPPLELSSEEEYRLWKNWFDEISGWLDKFDNQCHFRDALPIMAQSCDHLRFSMLAVSARQLELKHGSTPTDQSLALYQQAIHLLLPQLHTRSTAVIASCVVLCVLEMLSCAPKAWRRHLDGCAHLMQAVGITGFSGGVEQALFWCFARMDVCGGLIDSLKTLIPVDQWASRIDIDADIGLFRASNSFDMYANQAVYLCGRVVDVVSLSHNQRQVTRARSFTDQWLKVWRYVQDWESKRPAEMLPAIAISTATLTPFPTILFSNPAAISGTQLFHTACILLLQNKPSNLRLEVKPRSIQWHARQICGIALSHEHHGAWTNSVQPLWIAGKCMSQPEEQKALLGHLNKIETESGWGTRWRMQDLKDYWEIEYG